MLRSTAGFPFVRTSVKATTTIDLSVGTSIIRLEGIAGDAARIEIDGTDCGFAWDPDWLIHLPKSIIAGRHTIALKLYPSAFNVMGPHHHCDGDIHVVSPAQFEGTKNFADRLDAPAQTHVSAWHIWPLRFPSGIAAGKADPPGEQHEGMARG